MACQLTTSIHYLILLLLAHRLSSSSISISFYTQIGWRDRERNGVVDPVPNGGGFSRHGSSIFAGDLRIQLQNLQCAQAFHLSQISSSSQLLHRLGRLSMGHLHRRHHHVQVSPFLSLLSRRRTDYLLWRQAKRNLHF